MRSDPRLLAMPGLLGLAMALSPFGATACECAEIEEHAGMAHGRGAPHEHDDAMAGCHAACLREERAKAR